MACKVRHIKRGLGGSRNGRGRSEKTATLKQHSKKARRVQGQREIAEQLAG